MEDVVVFAALAWEAGVVLDGLQAVDTVAPRAWRGFLGDGARVRVYQTGMGPVRAERAAAEAPAAALYLSIGCAGALAGGMHCGDVVAGEHVVAIDEAGVALGTLPLAADGIARWAALRGVSLRRGGVASSPVVVGTREGKLAAARTGALVVDMECAGVAGVARRRGIATGALKVVLDEVGDGVMPPAGVIDPETGDLRRTRAVAALALRPRTWTSSVRLAHQRRVAEGRLRAFVVQLFGAGLDGLGTSAAPTRSVVPA